jgi:hypothetical protein
MTKNPTEANPLTGVCRVSIFLLPGRRSPAGGCDCVPTHRSHPRAPGCGSPVKATAKRDIDAHVRQVEASGALPAKRVNEILDRVVALQTAVKFAREAANSTETLEQRVGAAVFGYLFG